MMSGGGIEQTLKTRYDWRGVNSRRVYPSHFIKSPFVLFSPILQVRLLSRQQ